MVPEKSIFKISFSLIFFILFLGFVFILIFGVTPVFAQGIPGVGTESVLVEINPSFPRPYENVSVKLTSYSGDLDRAKISWSLGGKTIRSGVGAKTFSFKMGAVGTPTTIGVGVEGLGIGIFQKSITLNPAQVDILWQALDSYVPPFYRGKALPARMSLIRAVAMPDMKTKLGESVKSKDLVYKWTHDDNPMLDNSGIGKNFADLSLDFVSDDATLKVNASSVKEAGLSAENTAYFSTTNPKIIFYENKPLGGIDYENALQDSFSLKNAEVEIVAEPYYFTSPNGSYYLSYDWLLNGAPIQTSGNKSIVLRTNDQESGVSELSLRVKHTSRFLQVAGTALKVNFGSGQ